MPAGELKERLRFEKRETRENDGFGNRDDHWVEQFTTAARVRPIRGSETVTAARLGGIQPVAITIRSFAASRLVAPDWRAIDTRSRATFNIRSAANFDERNRYLEFLAESGVPT